MTTQALDEVVVDGRLALAYLEAMSGQDGWCCRQHVEIWALAAALPDEQADQLTDEDLRDEVITRRATRIEAGATVAIIERVPS